MHKIRKWAPLIPMSILLVVAVIGTAKLATVGIAGQMKGPLSYQPPEAQVPPEQSSVNVSVASGWPISPDVNAKSAETIVIGTVRQVGEARWSTADGSKPSDVSPRAMERNRTEIYRPVVIDVERYLKNPKQANQLTIVALGGTVGADSIRWESKTHQYRPTEKVVVFLYKPAGEDQKATPMWSVYEKYTVSADGTASTEFESMPLDQLIKRIETAVANP